jgi:hypothetical protein
MTHEEFDKNRWGFGIEGVYSGNSVEVVGVNFTERLIEVCNQEEHLDCEDCFWIRCENFELTPPAQEQSK